MKLSIQVILILVALAISISSCLESNDIKKEVAIDKQFLNVPLLMEPSKRILTLKVDGILFGRFHIPLAPDNEDYYGFIDLSQHQGKTLTQLEQCVVVYLSSVDLCS